MKSVVVYDLFASVLLPAALIIQVQTIYDFQSIEASVLVDLSIITAKVGARPRTESKTSFISIELMH